MSTSKSWHEANQEYLSLALVGIRQRLEQLRDVKSEDRKIKGLNRTEDGKTDFEISDFCLGLHEISKSMSGPPALEILCRHFELSTFERDVLLLCAGIELESSFSALVASVQSGKQHSLPSFSLALAALENPHWSALSPASPLRRWHLIEVEPEGSLTTSPLRIDEKVLHYLAGIVNQDERLSGMIEPVVLDSHLIPTHAVLAKKIADTWIRAEEKTRLPAIQLLGEDLLAKKVVAAAACNAVGMNLHALSARMIPSSPNELEMLIRLWERDSVLGASALLLICDDIDTPDAGLQVMHFASHAGFPLIVSSRFRRREIQDIAITMDVGKPTGTEQRQLWSRVAEGTVLNLNGQLDAIVSEFDFSAKEIQNAWIQASNDLEMADSSISFAALWRSCRQQSRPHLDSLATRVQPAASWDDLVLPPGQKSILRDIAAHVRNRAKVYNDWGFKSKISHGLGITVLFSGASGTGKTMAAEALACELGLDLYRIDLSSVVSKYIGETEKNLKRVFDAAEQGGSILLFDEADALFGKRSEVKDSHDRYANIEVSYLLQRMEEYRGLAILTTNMKSSLDPAFMRRIRFAVQFPFPDSAQRAEIWMSVFPESAPTDGLDMDKLSRLSVAGGNIRNIALYAAFLAADEGRAINMIHLRRAAQVEYSKLEKPLTEAEVGEWT